MKLDTITLCISALLLLIAIVLAWPYLKRYLSNLRKKESPPNVLHEVEIPNEDDTFPMARATNDTQVLNYTPKDEELEHNEACVESSEDQVLFAIDQESDYTVFLLKNVPKKEFHEAIIGLMRSRMEITDLNGQKLSMEEILSEEGEAEEPVKEDNRKPRVIDPEPEGQRTARVNSALKQLNKKKSRKTSNNG